MGEAKRRKVAGAYPEQDDPIEAARKFWAGKGQTRADEFRVPEGTIAITFDVQGVNPSTAALNPGDYHLFAPALEPLTKARTYYSVVRMLAKEFKRARLAGGDGPLNALPWLALWTAYNHPQTGEVMRNKVSAMLRREGKAHISWQYGDNGLAMGLSDRFIDLEPVAALAPKDRMTTITKLDPPEDPLH